MNYANSKHTRRAWYNNSGPFVEVARHGAGTPSALHILGTIVWAISAWRGMAADCRLAGLIQTECRPPRDEDGNLSLRCAEVGRVVS